MDKTTTQAQQTATAPAVPAERTVQQKFLYIMDLAMRLNSTPTARGETDDKPTVMIYLHGQIAGIEIDIHSGGWEIGQSADMSCVCSLDGHTYDLGRDRDYHGDPHSYLTIDQTIAYLETQVAKWCND